MFKLPTSKLPALNNNPRILVIYGPPKVGKTELLSKLEDCLIVDLERGSSFIEALKVEVNSLDELNMLIYQLGLPSSPKYKYIAIDTITRLEDWCEPQATANYRISLQGKNFTGKSVLELPNGGGYFWLRAEFNRRLASLEGLSEHLILVGHVREKFLGNLDSPTGTTAKDEVVSAQDIDLTGKLRTTVCSKADAIGYMYRKRQEDRSIKLMISFITSDSLNCGSRNKHLAGQSFEFTDWSKIYKH